MRIAFALKLSNIFRGSEWFCDLNVFQAICISKYIPKFNTAQFKKKKKKFLILLFIQLFIEKKCLAKMLFPS